MASLRVFPVVYVKKMIFRYGRHGAGNSSDGVAENAGRVTSEG